MPGIIENSNKSAAGIFVKVGKAGDLSPMRLSVCPHWSILSIDNIYIGAAKGKRSFTISTLIGDLILVQAAAYSRVSLRFTA